MNRIIILGVAAGLTLTACVSDPNDPNKNTKEKAAVGATIGALAGAVIGYQGDHSGGALRGALIGGAAGGALGAGVGIYMDKQQAEFNRQLAAEQQAHQIEVERLQNENLKITMNSEISFDYNSAQLKPAFTDTLNKVADILKRYPRSTIRITGHTDNRGSTQYNQQLSEQRAQAVKWYLSDRGVDPRRIIAEGRGELQPRATNDTEAGRQLNRRVEMLIVPDQDIQ
ncbi:OmpA family protein [Mariprofundus ferrooxydans]|uniref:OmpA/MotB n=1 Tax=Mariprofundus ferrooxydans PV-1 TaxID=314345 RepID=Q0EWK6_9PROT|nr:OmpA family protein [Mariprofundus ferrooxydans]EAU53671.1 OmpA/MotB [Mariprofundus ferrooxydans PV-1]KON47298.1 flagellar motor protein MotB [Mariprofundus ferrooxydans]